MAHSGRIGGLNGIDAVQQAEANRNDVSQVVFEENASGLRRATINIYQVQSNGTKVRVSHHNGRIKSDGSVGIVDND